jgi:energy-converting hydrogenase Eha subunit C
MLGKIKKIQADLSENMLKSGYFITILHKDLTKLSTALLENISSILLCLSSLCRLNSKQLRVQYISYRMM